jgi:galactan endo-1,6-beta-galactosidase
MPSHGFCAGLAWLTIAILAAWFHVTLAAADYTLTVDKNDNRGTWEGWGCSICWWGHGLGNSDFQDLHADLFFTTKTVTYFGKELPGLGMNIVRYNVGGGGRGDVIETTKENVAPKLPWFKDIDGYWVNWFDKSPASKSWDWTRDANQRSVLQAACKRGVTWVEFFSNAPMWWMTDSKSSDGGHLQAWNENDFAVYLATVAKYAQANWNVKVRSVSPFNEPSAGWWNYPHGQEGCNIPKEQQKNVLGHLRAALDVQGLNGVQITASDENSMKQARASYEYFKAQRVPVDGKDRVVAELVDKINVHAYSGQQPWRDNGAREALRNAAGAKRLWMSEYGDNDGSGMELARTIPEDLNHLRPSAWVYWQPVEPHSAWGLVNAGYDKAADMAERGKPKWVYTKYYVFAQFTRFLREGYQVIGTNDRNSIVAYDAAGKRLILITLNYATPQAIHYDLSTLATVGAEAAITFTQTDGKAIFSSMTAPIAGKKFTLNAEANTVYSIVVDGVIP